MTQADMRSILDKMSQAMTTEAKELMVQSQSMTSQANRDVTRRVHQYVSTMDSRIRYFTRINPPTFYRCKTDEDSEEFIDEVYKIFYAMLVSTIEKAELATYQLKDFSQTLYVQWR